MRRSPRGAHLHQYETLSSRQRAQAPQHCVGVQRGEEVHFHTNYSLSADLLLQRWHFPQSVIWSFRCNLRRTGPSIILTPTCAWPPTGRQRVAPTSRWGAATPPTEPSCGSLSGRKRRPWQEKFKWLLCSYYGRDLLCCSQLPNTKVCTRLKWEWQTKRSFSFQSFYSHVIERRLQQDSWGLGHQLLSSSCLCRSEKKGAWCTPKVSLIIWI